MYIHTDGQQVSSASNSKVDLAWQELDRYKQMTEREKRELDHERQSLNLTTNQAAPPTSRPLPIPAKPVATLLSMWTAREHHKASTNHVEFAGRRKFGERAELYLFMKNSGRYEYSLQAYYVIIFWQKKQHLLWLKLCRSYTNLHVQLIHPLSLSLTQCCGSS